MSDLQKLGVMCLFFLACIAGLYVYAWRVDHNLKERLSKFEEGCWERYGEVVVPGKVCMKMEFFIKVPSHE